MDQANRQQSSGTETDSSFAIGSSSDKQPWEQPKLTFVEPKLTRHGKLQEVTGQDGDGFFGGFTA
jgi:hypothetical protein